MNILIKKFIIWDFLLLYTNYNSGKFSFVKKSAFSIVVVWRFFTFASTMKWIGKTFFYILIFYNILKNVFGSISISLCALFPHCGILITHWNKFARFEVSFHRKILLMKLNLALNFYAFHGILHIIYHTKYKFTRN